MQPHGSHIPKTTTGDKAPRFLSAKLVDNYSLGGNGMVAVV